MKRLNWGFLLVLVTGCDNLENGLVPVREIAGEFDMMLNTCEFDSGGESAIARNIPLDRQTQFSLVVLVRNTLQTGRVNVAANPPEVLERSNEVTPLRFDYRWECDSTFLSTTGPLVLPAFAVDRPFCFDNRDETSRNFIGFDVISATGPAIPAGDIDGALVEIRPGNVDLLNAMRDSFIIGRVADECCRAQGGCQQDNLPPDTSVGACDTLTRLFMSVGNGVLSTESEADIETFRGLAKYTEPPLNSSNQPTLGGTPVYPLRLRGVFEGITSSGDVITSAEYSIDLGVCLDGCRYDQCSDH